MRIDSDARKVKELQEGYGGWVSGMEKVSNIRFLLFLDRY